MSGSLEWCALCGIEMTLAGHRDVWYSDERRARRAARPGAPHVQLGYGEAAYRHPSVRRAFEAHLRRSRVLIARAIGGEPVGRTHAELAAEVARRGLKLADVLRRLDAR